MDNRKPFEAIVGGIILLICGLFFTHIFKQNEQVKKSVYKNVFYAKFNNIDGIKVGTEIKIAGVRVGFVENIELDNNTFQVKVKMNINDSLNIPMDSVVAVASSGLLGGKFLNIKPGVEDTFLTNGSTFQSTQSSLNLEDLIGKVVAAFGSK